MAATFLHGDLEMSIVAARGLGGTNKSSRPNVVVYLGDTRLAQTHAATSDPMNPSWNQLFKLPVAHNVSALFPVRFEIKDKDTLLSKTIGMAQVRVNRIALGQQIDEWFQVTTIMEPEHENRGVTYSPQPASIHLRILFLPCRSNPNSDTYEVSGTYFPLRRGGAVTLYQDAHVRAGEESAVQLDRCGRVFRNEPCWQDMCRAILEAKRLVYIAGWSAHYWTKLVREPTTRQLPRGSRLTLGDLLKRKADQGVRVVLMLWDDPTSVDLPFLRKGIMKTCNKETQEFFKFSSVMCLLVPRSATGLIYSHHQKCVILDTKHHHCNNRKITAFLGGLDLCSGRYDTPQHRLFLDKDTVFEDDNFNPSLKKGERGPRQPWHDLHCRIEGPAAYDVLENFEECWGKATSSFSRVMYANALIDVENDPLITSPSTLIPNDPERWHVQIFRSIDSKSLERFPVNVFDAEEQNLAWIKNRAVDNSIQNAHVQAIRSAQRFIYIENQYFIGSSFAWPSFQKAGADNLIPIELALKIASKIRAKERFTVYVVIPMWPEGDPNSASVMNILFWQRLTMQMMYNVITEEIKAARLKGAHPTDYLNFYCLGNREECSNAGAPGRNDSASQRSKRFMVYVHSKGMIVDDAYVILGSANINERSMAGVRDTEIAMGAYQPHHTWEKKNEHPRGQVYGYRMSEWAEHIGRIEDCFNIPESLKCVKYVNRVAENNWKRYMADQFTRSLQGHILKYPMEVSIDGDVNPLPGYRVFPDVGGLVGGFPTDIRHLDGVIGSIPNDVLRRFTT